MTSGADLIAHRPCRECGERPYKHKPTCSISRENYYRHLRELKRLIRAFEEITPSAWSDSA